jgi:hypothetical protein
MPLTFESTANGATLYARRKDDRVLCVDAACGVPLAWILGPNADHAEKEPFVWFPPGWVWQRDGAWTVSTRAIGRLRQGRTPQAERVIANRLVAGPTGWVPYMPAVAYCYLCHRRQLLSPEVLGVSLIVNWAGKSACGFPRCPRLVENKIENGMLVTPAFCPDHEGERAAHGWPDRRVAGYPRVLFPGPERERWQREPLRLQ